MFRCHFSKMSLGRSGPVQEPWTSVRTDQGGSEEGGDSTAKCLSKIWDKEEVNTGSVHLCTSLPHGLDTAELERVVCDQQLWNGQKEKIPSTWSSQRRGQHLPGLKYLKPVQCTPVCVAFNRKYENVHFILLLLRVEGRKETDACCHFKQLVGVVRKRWALQLQHENLGVWRHSCGVVLLFTCMFFLFHFKPASQQQVVPTHKLVWHKGTHNVLLRLGRRGHRLVSVLKFPATHFTPS